MESEQTKQAVDKLLTTANLFRMRGNMAEAARYCEQALEADADNAMAHDFLADLLVAQGQLPEAMEHYQRSFKLQPRVVVEDKIARLALRIEDDKRLRAIGMESGAPAAPHRHLNPSMACLLSMLFPGLGQLYNGQMKKGGILFAVGMLSLLTFAAVAIPQLPSLQATLMGGRESHGLAAPAVSGSLWFLGLIVSVVWGYAMVDASLAAVAINRGEVGQKTGWEV